MFKLTDVYEFDWPVTVKKPVDGGKFAAESFTVRFLMVPRARLVELARDGGFDLLREVVVGWRDVNGEGDAAIAFTEEAREQLIAIPYVRAPLIDAYTDAIEGKARRKN